ncbi:hypothetical protein DITRI_Ditri02bG0053100 [Diplodiscus trichospermus]
MGRRKIEMEMVKDKGLRQVTFSKRRLGMFKKADELATLCGAQVAIIVFSPGGKPYSFGHPSVESVAQRFLDQEATPNVSIPDQLVDQPQQENLLRQQLDGLLKQIEVEKKRGEVLEEEFNASGKDKVVKKTLNELKREELLKMMKSMVKLREKLIERASEIEASSSLLLLSSNLVNLVDHE